MLTLRPLQLGKEHLLEVPFVAYFHAAFDNVLDERPSSAGIAVSSAAAAGGDGVVVVDDDIDCYYDDENDVVGRVATFAPAAALADEEKDDVAVVGVAAAALAPVPAHRACSYQECRRRWTSAAYPQCRVDLPSHVATPQN